jgi:hypothetical protein
MVDLLTSDEPKVRMKLRHINIHQHWLRQEVQAGRVSIRWIKMSEMPVDGLTKILPRQKHYEFMRQISLVDPD